MKIGIIVGSVRDGRKGRKVGDWVLARARAHGGADHTLIDLKDFDLPLLTAAVNPAAAKRRYDDPRVTAWSEAIDPCDAFVFVTAEYNHSIPGAFKNAVDSLAPEWQRKAVAFVSYGSVGGVRAVEHWRGVVANFSMVAIRPQVTFFTFEEFDDAGAFAPHDRREGELATLLDALHDAARRTRE